MSITIITFWADTPSKPFAFHPAASNQHPTLAARLEEPGSTVPLLLPAALPHIHSKTPCQGANVCQWHACYKPTGAVAQTESFCLCKKSQVSQLQYLIFFVSRWNVLATKYDCVPCSAYCGVSERQWRSAANRPSRFASSSQV